MAVDLSAYFELFVQNISLGNPQVPRMNSASNTIADFLQASYGLAPGDVFLQGSYENGTAIEPVDGGEYDVDIVAVCVGEGLTANAALDDLEQRFAGDGRFRDRIKRKKPCVRLEYAPDDVGKFHVDVVPVHRTGMTLPPLQAPRRGEGWRGTAPQEYTNWCRNQGDLFVRTAKILKRWRSEQQTVRDAIKSIVLQVLIADCMPHVHEDATRVAETIRALERNLRDRNSPPEVLNPVLPSENLAAGWDRESFRSFVGELKEAVEWVDKATTTDDGVEAADAWRELLGDDFPIVAPSQLGLMLGDFSHAETPAERGWSEELDGRYRVTLDAHVQRGRRGQTRRPYPSDGPPIFAPNKLRFTAKVVAPNHVDVWWQVANTGGHARAEAGLRGAIFKAKTLDNRPSRDETVNWESTAYTGSHLIRALLVRSNTTVVAESDWFRVNIWAKGHRFRI
jgi:hypothetical protein